MVLLRNLITEFTLLLLLLLQLLLLLFVTTFVWDIYNYRSTSEANHISRLYCAAAILWLRYMVRVLLFSILNTFTTVLPSYYLLLLLLFLFFFCLLLLLLLLFKSVKTIILWCICNCSIFVMISEYQS